ncbi:MAG TPA: cation:proton antiporter [Steroidobacteraceae bacterium]
MDGVHLFEMVIAMLFAIIALHYLAQRLRLPPAVALLGGGALLAFLPGLPVFSLDPALVLVIFLPPLLLDGAWFIPLRPLKRHLTGILFLAIGAVLFTTVGVAIVAHALLPWLPWAACAALGAVVSPPDAVSARAVLQRVNLPQRLSILLEGESLLNDASGLVLFRFAVAAAVTGSFSAIHALGSFLLLALGGAAVGGAVGLLWFAVVRRLQDDYLTIAASVLVAWAAYLLAETLHVPGVIATVVTGLICGWYQHAVLVRGYKERGNINTPLELAILNQVDRFNLVIDVIDRVPTLGARAAHLKEDMRDSIIDNLAYAHSEGTDRPEVSNWTWPG